MMVRSRDHRSAGLWWSLPLSGGGLGGHGRLHKSFQSLIITFVPAGAAVDYFCDEIHRDQWTKELAPPQIILVIEFAVDRWVIRRGPLDLSLMIGWAGLPFFFWALDLADGFLAISLHVLSTVDYWACWALDPWWITEMLGFEPLVDH
uniref:Uncharacterized protein n=1 Tax=Fagus sylvatica TaxID=28930 RepID=A0A2N9EK25_FAGSY